MKILLFLWKQDEQEFCEHFVHNGIKEGKDRRELIAQALQARKATI